MSVPQRCMRGLQDIRTSSGSVGPADVLSKAYLKIACLEMEKERRGRERASAAHRVENINTRFQEIEAEEQAILGALGLQHGHAGPPAPSSSARPQQGQGGVRIKY